MVSALDDLKFEYYLANVAGATRQMSLSDLEYQYFTSPPAGGGGGFTPGAWTAISTFNASAGATVDATISALRVRKEQTDIARLKGGVDFSGIISAGTSIMTMPAGFIPAKNVVLVARLPTVFTRVIILSDGTVTLNVATSAGTTLNLDGLTYTLAE